ncbi:MAG: hypothetical protein KJ043_01870 [Anaerolineae bacterium]|nr:hypothetical protein [Anaerolineae bacterium]
MPIHTTQRYTGETLVMTYDSIAISADFLRLVVDDSIGTVDITAGNASDRAHIATTRQVIFRIDLLQQAKNEAGTAIRQALRVGNHAELVYAPEGTATGSPRYACSATVTACKITYPFEDVVRMEVELRRDGAFTAHFEDLGSVY